MNRDDGQNTAGEKSGAVVITDQYELASTNGDQYRYQYKGLPIHALPGLHEHVFAALQRHVLEGRVLDLAAGSGAMAQRCLDNGYQVVSSDIVVNNFRLHGRVPFVRADLNQSFATIHQERFDAVIAVELVEHLENPRHFLRQCRECLRPGGVLLLTTPNINSPMSKALFVRNGLFNWFTDEDYGHHGHITPITQWLMEKAIGEVGFTVVEKDSFGDAYARFRSWPKMVWLARLLALVSANDGYDGDIVTYVVKHG